MDVPLFKNPWAVDSLNNFSFYCCPECPDIRIQRPQDFVDHAFLKHPEGAPALFSIKDQTVQGLTFPQSLKVESDIKNEIEINFTENVNNLDIEPMDDYEDNDFSELKGDFKCLVCQQTFDTAGKLSSHGCASVTKTIIKPKLVPKNPKDFETFDCSECDFKTFNYSQLVAHEKRHKRENNCDECGLKFTSNAKLKNHLLKEHKLSKDVENVYVVYVAKL